MVIGMSSAQALDYDCHVQQQDIPQAIQLLGEMNSNVKQVTDLVESMLQRVKRGELTTEYGLSFLEVKYHMLLDYLINLTYVVLRKCSGETIEGDPSIERLIEIRTVLEKIRPIDHKLRYQIDKLVKTATTGVSSSSDPILYKPNPDNMLTNAGGEENAVDDIEDATENSESESDDEDDEGETGVKKPKKGATAGKSGIYVPPKIKPVYYDGDEKSADKDKKMIERAKKRAITASMLQDLKEEYLDAPTELSSGSRAQQLLSKQQKEKQEYEETYLTRLPVTKAEKHRQRKLTTLGTLGDEILGEISRDPALRGEASTGGSKKRKLKGKGKKRGGKKRKFH
ncbi:PREDICTED: neuroguidin [Rhagoletis zephyria]|uniref:neuroguidin n=1 Tax=Rhagoletis zephyria TaxID=28612 RepID=UPI0008114BE9|nr:PREDICTED: neuroguidin [Rhagoletis zephyria]